MPARALYVWTTSDASLVHAPIAKLTRNAVLHARAQQRDRSDIHMRGVQHDARGWLLNVQLNGH